MAWLPENEEETPPPVIPPVNVRVWPIQSIQQLPDTFDLTAVVEPEQIVEVAAEVPGRIERYGERKTDVTWRGQTLAAGETIDEGEPVQQGAPLVHLNRDLLQARYDRAQAQFEYDQREYRRILDLAEDGTSSPTEVDDAKTHRDIAKALLEEARRELERCLIVAPCDGILNRLIREPGEYVNPGTPVAEIVNIDRVKVVVDVPERDVHYLAVGDPAEVHIGQVAGVPPRIGRVTYISEVADEATRTTRLEILVDNGDHLLRSGQIVRARLTRRVLHDIIMIPLSSVIPLEHGRVVYIVNDDKLALRRDVELGFIKGRSVRVLSGLTAGERLIVDGHRYVGPQQPVNITETVTLPQVTP